jgi:hypothetical protein
MRSGRMPYPTSRMPASTCLVAEAAVADESRLVFDGPESVFGGDDLANVVGLVPARIAPRCDRFGVGLRECPNLHLRMLTLRTSVRKTRVETSASTHGPSRSSFPLHIHIAVSPPHFGPRDRRYRGDRGGDGRTSLHRPPDKS